MNIKVLEGNKKVILDLILQFWFRSAYFRSSRDVFSNPVIHLRLSVLSKQLTAKSSQYFSQNALFDRDLDAPSLSFFVAVNVDVTLYRKCSFPLRMSSVNVTKTIVSCGFGHI